MRKRLVTATALAVIGYLVWRDPLLAFASILTALIIVLPFLVWYEPRLIYYPHFPTRQHIETPANRGLAFEEVHLTAADGIKLHGWFIPCTQAPVDTVPLTVLFLHGNAGNISHRAERFATFNNLGANLLLIDYRGYGSSEGKPHEKGTYLDAQAAYEYLAQTRGIKPQRIVVYGESLGTAVAVDLAANYPCGGVILEAPFTSVPDVAQKMFPILPVRPLVRNRYDSLSKIANIKAPLLIFHSRTDEMFAIHHAERLLAAAPEPKQLIELQGGHSDAFLMSADLHRQTLQEFFRYAADKSAR